MHFDGVASRLACFQGQGYLRSNPLSLPGSPYNCHWVYFFFTDECHLRNDPDICFMDIPTPGHDKFYKV